MYKLVGATIFRILMLYVVIIIEKNLPSQSSLNFAISYLMLFRISLLMLVELIFIQIYFTLVLCLSIVFFVWVFYLSVSTSMFVSQPFKLEAEIIINRIFTKLKLQIIIFVKFGEMFTIQVLVSLVFLLMNIIHSFKFHSNLIRFSKFNVIYSFLLIIKCNQMINY